MKNNLTKTNIHYCRTTALMKSLYFKPTLDTIIIHTEWAIAEGSVHLGPDTDNFIPNIDDFDDTAPVIEGIGDI